jgi:hypothetical protein
VSQKEHEKVKERAISPPGTEVQWIAKENRTQQQHYPFAYLHHTETEPDMLHLQPPLSAENMGIMTEVSTSTINKQ